MVVPAITSRIGTTSHPRLLLPGHQTLATTFSAELFGRNGKSVLRGGFRMTYDRIGSQLAVNFDLNSVLGFTGSQSNAANTFNVSDRLGPLFAGTNPSVRGYVGNYSQQPCLPVNNRG